MCNTHFFQPKLDQKLGVHIIYKHFFYPISSEHVSGYRGGVTADIACYASCMSID